MSGKAAINVSLPVTIFNIDSNVERSLKSWSLGPHFIEESAKIPNPIERMKFAVAFGISSSALYFNIQKPFNPILG